MYCFPTFRYIEFYIYIYFTQKQALETATAESMAPNTPRVGSAPASPLKEEDSITSTRAPFGVLKSSSNDDDGLAPLNATNVLPSDGGVEFKRNKSKKRSDHAYVNDDSV